MTPLDRLLDPSKPVVWVCSQCVVDGTTPTPDLSAVRRNDGLCGPHADIARLDLARRRRDFTAYRSWRVA